MNASLKPRRIALLVVMVGAVAALGITVRNQRRESADREAEAQRLQAAGQAWVDLWQCALGGQTPDAEIQAQARRIALAKPEQWPAKCSTHATALYQAVTEASHPRLRAALRERFACDTACSVSDPGRQMVNLAHLGADLPHPPPSSSTPPMAAPPALTQTSLKVVAPADAEVVRREVVGGRARLQLKSATKGRFACSLQVDGSELSCTAVAADVPPGAALVAHSDRLLLVEGDDTFAPDGRRVSTHVGRTAGPTLRLQGKSKDAHRWEVAMVKNGKSVRASRVELPRRARPLLLGDVLAWTEPDPEPRLKLRRLQPAGELLGDEAAVGTLPEDGTHPQRCGPALVMGLPPAVAVSWPTENGLGAPVVHEAKPTATKVAPPEKPKSPKSPEAASARDFGMAGLLEGVDVEDGGWGAAADGQGEVKTSPMYQEEEVRTRPPQAHRASRRPHHGRIAMACTDQRADVYWRQPRPRDIELHRIGCTREGCTEATVTFAGIDPLSWWWVGPVGEVVVVLWRGQDGLLRMRHGPFEQLASRPDRIVMDSQEHGGPETLAVEVFPGREAVVFWFRSKRGSHAIRIGADGTITSLSSS